MPDMMGRWLDVDYAHSCVCDGVYIVCNGKGSKYGARLKV
jgi:hypothetical protein